MPIVVPREPESLVECSICLELKIEANGVVFQLERCNHSFHRQCLRRLLRAKSSNCPLCRVMISLADVRRITSTLISSEPGEPLTLHPEAAARSRFPPDLLLTLIRSHMSSETNPSRPSPGINRNPPPPRTSQGVDPHDWECQVLTAQNTALLNSPHTLAVQPSFRAEVERLRAALLEIPPIVPRNERPTKEDLHLAFSRAFAEIGGRMQMRGFSFDFRPSDPAWELPSSSNQLNTRIAPRPSVPPPSAPQNSLDTMAGRGLIPSSSRTSRLSDIRNRARDWFGALGRHADNSEDDSDLTRPESSEFRPLESLRQSSEPQPRASNPETESNRESHITPSAPPQRRTSQFHRIPNFILPLRNPTRRIVVDPQTGPNLAELRNVLNGDALNVDEAVDVNAGSPQPSQNPVNREDSDDDDDWYFDQNTPHRRPGAHYNLREEFDAFDRAQQRRLSSMPERPRPQGVMDNNHINQPQVPTGFSSRPIPSGPQRLPRMNSVPLCLRPQGVIDTDNALPDRIRIPKKFANREQGRNLNPMRLRHLHAQSGTNNDRSRQSRVASRPNLIIPLAAHRELHSTSSESTNQNADDPEESSASTAPRAERDETEG